jgi:CRP-like cAMP-binding protein
MSQMLPLIKRKPSGIHRVAMPIGPVTQKPSLIPMDVLHEVRVEQMQRRMTPDFDGEIRTSQVAVADGISVLGHMKADPEVALFALTQVSMFKSLPMASLETMAQIASQVEVPDGESLFVEGEDAVSFFVVVDGTLEILRKKEGREVALRHVKTGDAFGLFGLFSAQMRAASVRAIGDCTVLEIAGEMLQELLDQDDSLHRKMLDMYRERLIEGLMSSKVFSDIDSIARARIIGRFKNQYLPKDGVLLNPGEVTNVLAVVTHGNLMIEDRTNIGQTARTLEVTQGQFMAVTSAMSGMPSRMKVYAKEPVNLAVLTHTDFVEMIKEYPALRGIIDKLNQTATKIDKDIFAATTGIPGL